MSAGFDLWASSVDQLLAKEGFGVTHLAFEPADLDAAYSAGWLPMQFVAAVRSGTVSPKGGMPGRSLGALPDPPPLNVGRVSLLRRVAPFAGLLMVACSAWVAAETAAKGPRIWAKHHFFDPEGGPLPNGQPRGYSQRLDASDLDRLRARVLIDGLQISPRLPEGQDFGPGIWIGLQATPESVHAATEEQKRTFALGGALALILLVGGVRLVFLR